MIAWTICRPLQSVQTSLSLRIRNFKWEKHVVSLANPQPVQTPLRGESRDQRLGGLWRLLYPVFLARGGHLRLHGMVRETGSEISGSASGARNPSLQLLCCLNGGRIAALLFSWSVFDISSFNPEAASPRRPYQQRHQQPRIRLGAVKEVNDFTLTLTGPQFIRTKELRHI